MVATGLILLDRDGVINEMVVDPEHGTADSPLHPDQVVVLPEIPIALAELTKLGYLLAIVTNQPAAAKGKTTQKNLENTHEKIVKLAESAGAKILTSQICYHRREDKCACRKPKALMLENALALAGATLRSNTWMVGDSATDIEAGKAARVKTAFIGLYHCFSCQIMQTFPPDGRFKSLVEFVEFIKKNN